MKCLQVKDIEKSIDFYTKYLHFDLFERSKDSYAIISSSDFNLKINLENEKYHSLDSPELQVASPAIILEAKKKELFAKIYNKLIRGGIHVYPLDNVVSWSILFSDPDHNQIDVYLDRRIDAFSKYSANGINIDLNRERIFSVLN